MARSLIPVCEILGSTTAEIEFAQKMVKQLLETDFLEICRGSMSDWTNLLSLKQPNDRHTLPLGRHAGVEYWLAIETLGSASLNQADARFRLQDTLVDVTFRSSTGQEDNRRAVPVGRIIASHDGFSDVFQSRWVVLCDDTRSLWACYANDVAPIDLEPLRPDIQTRRYYIHPDVDHIFGAHRSEGELVVYLGKLDHMTFQMIDLNAIKVESVTWETYRAKVFNNGDLGSPMHPVGFKRLRDVKIRHIKRPRYTKKDFVYLTNVVGYDGFRADLNNANPGVVLGRQVTEAAYLSILIGRYVAYDAAQLSEKFPGGEMEEKQHMLFMALVQRYGVNHYKRGNTDAVTSTDDVEAYWKKREQLSPGLDIAWIPDDRLTPEVDESTQPEDTEMGDVVMQDDGQIPLVRRPLHNVEVGEHTQM